MQGFNAKADYEKTYTEGEKRVQSILVDGKLHLWVDQSTLYHE
jgi:hypothetical protein